MWNLPCGTGISPQVPSSSVDRRLWTAEALPSLLMAMPSYAHRLMDRSLVPTDSPLLRNTIRNVSHTNLQSLAQSYQSLEGQIQAITLITVNSDQGCGFHPKALLIQSLMDAGDGNQGNGRLVPFP